MRKKKELERRQLRKEYEQQNALKRIVRENQERGEGDGKVVLMSVFHDSWCPKLSGGSCSCNPDVRMTE